MPLALTQQKNKSCNRDFIIHMRRISQLFTAAAVGVCSILTAPASGAPVESPGLEGLMRADFAVAVAGGRISDLYLSDDQKKIIRLLRDMRKTPRGREMTDKAAQMGVVYAIHNYINGGAYYNTGTNIMGIELVDDGTAATDPVRTSTMRADIPTVA